MTKSALVSGYVGRTRPARWARPDPQRLIWVYDAAMAVLLAQVIRIVESMPADQRPGWWAVKVGHLREATAIYDIGLDLEFWSGAGQRRGFATLLEEAADQLGDRGPVTADEAAAWIVLDDQPVIFRGDQPLGRRIR